MTFPKYGIILNWLRPIAFANIQINSLLTCNDCFQIKYPKPRILTLNHCFFGSRIFFQNCIYGHFFILVMQNFRKINECSNSYCIGLMQWSTTSFTLYKRMQTKMYLSLSDADFTMTLWYSGLRGWDRGESPPYGRKACRLEWWWVDEGWREKPISKFRKYFMLLSVPTFSN